MSCQSSNRMQHITLCLLTASIMGCAPGIEDEPSEPRTPVQSVESALNGEPIFIDSSCDAYRTFLRQVLSKARDAIGSARFVGCLRQAALTYHESTFAERIVDELNQNVPTRLACVDLGSTAGLAMGGPGEGVNLNVTTLPTDVAEGNTIGLASLILHEVAHNKGYSHQGSGNNASDLRYVATPDYDLTVPMQVGKCALEALRNSDPASPYGGRRGDTTLEAILTPVGGGGGVMFERTCAEGSLMRGMDIFGGLYVDAFQPLCYQAPLGTTLTVGGKIGGPGGARVRAECGANGWAVGVFGSAKDVVHVLGLYCATVDDVLNGNTNNWSTGGAGTIDPTSYPFQRRCPKGMAVRGIKGRSGDLIDRLELECETLSPINTHREQELVPVGSLIGSTTAFERCPGRSMMVGLTTQSGIQIDRLGGQCREVSTSCANGVCTDSLRSTGTFMIPSHGGSGGGVGKDMCNTGYALIGMEFSAGNSIDALQGRCARITEWSRGDPAEQYLLPRHGGSGGSPKSRTCAPGKFLAGWRLLAGSFVNMLSLVCRDF